MAEMTTVCLALLMSVLIYAIGLGILASELSQSSSNILTRKTSGTADCIFYGACVIVAFSLTLSAVVKLFLWHRHRRSVPWLSVLIVLGGGSLGIVSTVYLVSLGPLNDRVTAGVSMTLLASILFVLLGIYIYKGPPGLRADAESVRRASTRQRLTSSGSSAIPPNYGSSNSTESSPAAASAVASGDRPPGHLQRQPHPQPQPQPQPRVSPSANNSPPAPRSQQEEEAEFTSPVRAAAEVLAATEKGVVIIAAEAREIRETAKGMAAADAEAAAKVEAAEAAREVARDAAEAEAAEKAEAEAAKEAAEAAAAEKAEAAEVEAAEAEVEAAEVEAATEVETAEAAAAEAAAALAVRREEREGSSEIIVMEEDPAREMENNFANRGQEEDNVV